MEHRTIQQRSVERQAAILAAARKLLNSEGMKAVSHRRVAEAAQVPIGSVGYYFSSREELLAQCLAANDASREESARIARGEAAPSLVPEKIGALAVRTIWGEVTQELVGDGLVGMVGAAMDGVRESRLLQEQVLQGRAVMDADLQALLGACGYPSRYAELVLAVTNGSIVNSGVEGHTADAFARAARDVGALLQRLGRD